MKLLYLDTAMNACGVGVMDRDSPSAPHVILDTQARGQAERLIPLIDKVIKEADMTPQSLDYIGVTRGPGTFTGLRIALSAAQSMGKALNIPVIGLSVQDLIAHQAMKTKASDASYIAVITETKRSDYYFRVYENKEGQIIPLTDALALELQDVVEHLKQYPAQHLICVGDAVDRLINEGGELGYNPNIFNIDHIDPKLALAYICAIKDVDAIKDLSPIYLRPADVSAPKIKREIAKK